MKRLSLSGVAVSCVLVGCASSSGVLQMGPDTFTISSGMAGTGSISGNDTAAKMKALREANEYCQQGGRQILVKNVGLKSTGFGSTSEIIFQCLPPGDPALQTRPEYRKEPDNVIKVDK